MNELDGKCLSNLFQMPNHYDNDCPTAPVPCFYSPFGCPEKVRPSLESPLAALLRGLVVGFLNVIQQPKSSVMCEVFLF